MPQLHEQCEKTQESERGKRTNIIEGFKRRLDPRILSWDKIDLVIAKYQKILIENPRDKDSWMVLGCAFDKKFQFEKAIDCKTKALSIDQADSEVKFSIGCSYCAKGDICEAIRNYLDALELRPDFSEACEAISEQYQILGQQEKAEEWLLRAEKIRSSK
jgi:tetratricopeptide (TPR) repeat protein